MTEEAKKLSPEFEKQFGEYKALFTKKLIQENLKKLKFVDKSSTDLTVASIEHVNQMLGKGKAIALPSKEELAKQLTMGHDSRHSGKAGFRERFLEDFFAKLTELFKSKFPIAEGPLDDEPCILPYDDHVNVLVNGQQFLLFRGAIILSKKIIKIFRQGVAQEWFEFAVLSPGDEKPTSVTIMGSECKEKFLKEVRKKCLKFWFNTTLRNVADYVDFYLTWLFRKGCYFTENECEFSGWMQDDNGAWHYLTSRYPNVKAAMYLPKPDRTCAITGFSYLRDMFLAANGELILSMFLIFIYAHLNFMVRMFKEGGLNKQFILYVFGKTGSFKTSIVSALCGGNFEDPKFVGDDGSSYGYGLETDFSSTPAALLQKLKTRMDSGMNVDDKFPGSDSKNKVWDTVVRACGDSHTPSKMDMRKNSIDAAEVFCNVWFTGESPVFRFESDALRVLHVGINPEMVNKAALDLMQDKYTKGNLTNYFAIFVEYLEENFSKLVQYIASNRAPYRARWSQLLNIAPGRTVDAASIFSLTLGIVHEAIVEKLGFEAFDMNAADLMLQQYFRGVVAANVQLKPEVIFVNAISEAYITGKIPLAADLAEFRVNDNVKGYYDESAGTVMIDPKFLKTLISARLPQNVKYPMKEDMRLLNVILGTTRPDRSVQNRPELLVFKKSILEKGEIPR